MYGERIRLLRKELKLTMRKFGEKFNLAESTISGYENETRKPDIDLIEKFADFFDVDADYILGRTNIRKNSLTDQFINAANKAKRGEGVQEHSADSADTEKNIGRAFLGGADKYTDEELDLARAAARAAVDAYRKGQRKRDEDNS